MFSTTVLITILGSLGGTLTRLLPEFIKMFNKYIDNKHEIQMLEKSNEIDKLKLESKVQVMEAMQFQTQPYQMSAIDITDIKSKKMDIINALVRPYATYILLTLYCVIKIAYFILNPGAALVVIWTPEDMAMLSGILSFWFLGRVLDKK